MARQNKKNSLQVEEKKPEGAPMSQNVQAESLQLETLQTELDLARVELEKTRKEIEENKKLLESRRDISQEEISIGEKQISRVNSRQNSNEIIDKQKIYDNQMVRGKFMNRRAPGMRAKLTYMHHADDPVKWYDFEDGKVYTIPRGFADEINNYYHTPVFVQKQGPMDPSAPTSQIHDVDKSNKKYAFVPVDF